MSSESLKNIKELADLGYLASFYADSLYHGKGVPQNKKEAAYYYKLAADKGDAVSASNYATMNFIGDGIPKNITEAVKYTKVASDLGDVTMMLNY